MRHERAVVGPAHHRQRTYRLSPGGRGARQGGSGGGESSSLYRSIQLLLESLIEAAALQFTPLSFLGFQEGSLAHDAPRLRHPTDVSVDLQKGLN